MPPREAIEIVGVAAAHDAGRRHPGGAAGLDHEAVAPGEPLVAEGEPAELVVGMGIDAGIVEHDVRPMADDESRQVGLQHGAIDRIAGAGGHADVEIARLLGWRVVRLAVEREGEGLRLAPKDRGGAVALMDVEIHDQRPLDQPFLTQDPDCDGDVVEEAEAGAVIGKGMVTAAGCVAGQSMLERETAGEHGAADRRAPAAHKCLGQRQTEASNGAAVERERQHRLHIRIVMGERQPRAGRRRGLTEARRRNHAVLQQHLLDPPELPDGEAVAGRERHGVVRVEDDRKGHGRRMQG